MSTQKLFHTLFEYKAWANDELFLTLNSFSDEAHAREKHDATRILNHVYVVDRIFEANVQGKPHAYTGLNTPETPAIADLHREVKSMDRWFIDYVATLGVGQLEEVIDFTFVDGSPGRMSRDEMLAHVVTHGGYHRGAVGRILAQVSIAPPRDILTVFLHRQNVK